MLQMLQIELIVYWIMVFAALLVLFIGCVYRTYVFYQELQMTETFDPTVIDNTSQKISKILYDIEEGPAELTNEEAV